MEIASAHRASLELNVTHWFLAQWANTWSTTTTRSPRSMLMWWQSSACPSTTIIICWALYVGCQLEQAIKAHHVSLFSYGTLPRSPRMALCSLTTFPFVSKVVCPCWEKEKSVCFVCFFPNLVALRNILVRGWCLHFLFSYRRWLCSDCGWNSSLHKLEYCLSDHDRIGNTESWQSRGAIWLPGGCRWRIYHLLLLVSEQWMSSGQCGGMLIVNPPFTFPSFFDFTLPWIEFRSCLYWHLTSSPPFCRPCIKQPRAIIPPA